MPVLSKRRTPNRDRCATDTAVRAVSVASGDPDFEEEEVGDDYDPAQKKEKLREHACAYCGTHDPACNVHNKANGRWYCNGREKLPGIYSSTHLMRSRRREAS